MNKRISQIAMLALLTGMISCGKKVPKDIIQPDAMENLLYDYHWHLRLLMICLIPITIKRGHI